MKRRAVTPGITHATPLATSEVPATAIVIELAAIASLMTMTSCGGSIASAGPAGRGIAGAPPAGGRGAPFFFVVGDGPVLSLRGGAAPRPHAGGPGPLAGRSRGG